MAIVLVLISHSTPHTEGGGLGVQIFFTLSGFLITALLLSELGRAGGVSYRSFYIRRLLRLYPALLLTLVLVAVLPDVYLIPGYDGVSDSRWITLPIALVYLTNFANALGVHMGYLGHTWSLAIEEQFYLIWPVVAVWLVRRDRFLKTVLVLIPLFALVRIAMYVAGVPSVPQWLPAQADQLLIGALLAFALRGGALPWWLGAHVAGWAALLVLAGLVTIGSVGTVGGMQGAFADLGGLLVCALASAVLIGHLVSSNGLLTRLFSIGPAVAIGRVSYGIYLLHFPIFQYVQHQRWAREQTYAVEFAATAVAVLVSWYVIERPTLRLKHRFEQVTPVGDPIATGLAT
jgi:peptidoglycan/LPS O-acetylase OafA/YrhL